MDYPRMPEILVDFTDTLTEGSKKSTTIYVLSPDLRRCACGFCNTLTVEEGNS